jgi:hypothetical protein
MEDTLPGSPRTILKRQESPTPEVGAGDEPPRVATAMESVVPERREASGQIVGESLRPLQVTVKV